MNTNEIVRSFANLLNGIETKLSINTAYENMISHAKIVCRTDTIKYYEKCFNSIYEWYTSNNINYVEDINCINLNQYIGYLKSYRGYKNNSCNKHIEVIKHVVKYNYDNELCKVNKIANFKKLKKDNIETKMIDKENIDKILTYLDTLNLDSIATLRNVLFIYVMKDTGARLNECRHIEIDNVYLNQNMIYLKYTKTNEPREVYISNKTKSLIEILLQRNEINGCKYLLSNYVTKEIVYRSAIYDFLNEIKSELNIDISISPHKWRHTLASNLLEKNINIKIVQEVLGHTSLEITKRYLHTEKDIKAQKVIQALEE